MKNLNKDVVRLLDKLYKDLYKSESVINHGSGNIYDKFNNIESYISDLENMHKRIIETGRHKDYLKKLYYDKYVIKKEYIKESYYKHQQEIALERGYGHVEITNQQKKQLQEEIINNQKRSLDTWLDYFLSSDASVYPFWAKYWAFQGMLKLGTYDKEKGTFNRRTKDTVEPFCDLNREALAMSIDMLIRMLNKEEFNDKELETLVKTGSFQKIYTYILSNILKDNKNITKRNIGKWVKYDQGSDHMPLVNSLQGYNTGWCTAGESTAKTQLEMGDFYVYYTLDENDEYKIPRIAIRMEYDEIAEIRGIAQDQNLEPEMEEVVEEKIKDFPDKEEYYKKVNDMKLLTHIYKKHQNKEKITKEELRFLYEIDFEIKGFGYEKDPRIEEIISSRENIKKDLAVTLDCKEENVALEKKDLTKDTIYYYGDLNYREITTSDKLILPKYVFGSLDLSGITSAEGLKLPNSIGGDLDLNGLISDKGLSLPQFVGGDIHLSLTSIKGLKFPETIGGALYLIHLITAEDLVLPKIIGESLFLDRLVSVKNLQLPEKIYGDLNLSSMTNIDELILPEYIAGSLNLSNLKTAKSLAIPEIGVNLILGDLEDVEGLIFPEEFMSSIILGDLKNVKNLKLPKKVRSLTIDSLEIAEGLVFPEHIQGGLFFNKLKNTRGIKLPKFIKERLFFRDLESAEGLKFPEKMDCSLSFEGLINADNLKLPREIGGYLTFDSLTSAKNLVFPKTIGKNLYCNQLTNVENVVLPENIGGAVCMYKLRSLDGLVIPEPLTYNIHLYDDFLNPIIITPQNIEQYKNPNKNNIK